MATEVVDGCAVHRAGAGAPLLCVPGFADSAASWRPLVAAMSGRYEVAVVDLPGFGSAPRPSGPAGVTGLAEVIVRLVRRCWADPVVLIGHSLGAAIAVRAAARLDERCRALVSIEGNLTTEDGYFSATAADHDDPETFQSIFTHRVQQLVAARRAPASYADSVNVADAACMWTLGRDSQHQGAADGFGSDFRNLRHPALYLWSRATTPGETQRYLRTHGLPHHELAIEHHWPWIAQPEAIGDVIQAFVSPTAVG